MAYDDLRRYAHEILVPLVTSLSGFGEDANVVRRMVEYAYPDKTQPGETSNLVLEIVKVGGRERDHLILCFIYFREGLVISFFTTILSCIVSSYMEL